MEHYGSGQRPYGVGRRPEIVSGRSFGNNNQIYASRPGSPDLAAATRANRPRQSASKPWGFSDPEMQRKTRVAKYKVYGVEGRVKASLKNGIRWIKNKCSQIIHGY
ncbi:hypothetical protein K2173_025468 [Erythroxylum novogranatense]|uniref:DUF3511 domain protein n=1 Tax=Erythroxylum novogranatense TaxID=1862640 RepID=A0AAV8SBA7_9ROSI|nr:hypothetical protein K2173_025468 [Erythroxylum novogranatense]